MLNRKASELNISNNSITSLPSEIGELSKLRILNVSNNLLTGALPAEIRKITNLKELIASNNRLTGIPAEIGQLSNLEIIDFSNNSIDSFPLEIANIKGNLKEIDISNNNFSEEKLRELEGLLPSTIVIKWVGLLT